MKATGPLSIAIALALIAYEKRGSALFLSSRVPAAAEFVGPLPEALIPPLIPAKVPAKRSIRKSR